MALATKGKKKSKKGPKDGAKQLCEQKKGLSKVKCFSCNKMGHYAVVCPNKKKKKKQIAASTKVDEFA